MKSKKLWIAIVVIFLVAIFYRVSIAPVIKSMTETRTVKYDRNLTLVLGGGGNSGILSGDNAVLVIDTKMSSPSKKLYEMAKQMAGDKPIIVVNTHFHPDHVGGNSFYKGSKIFAGGNYSKDFWVEQSGEKSLPTEWVKDTTELKIGDETVVLKNMPYSVHTRSDMLVYLKKRKMLFTGDMVLNRQAPALMKKSGVDVAGYLKAFEDIPKYFDVQNVVPGHGDNGGPEILANFKQYFTDMQDAANDASKEKEMMEKYKDWRQMPMFMSNSKTIKFMREQKIH